MKHYLLLSVFLLGAVTQVHGQYNGSFEKWHNVGGWYDDPDSWTTNNTQLFVPIVKDSVYPYTGKYSMRVNSNGVVTSPKEQINMGSGLGFYCRCSISGNDTVTVKAICLKGGQPVYTRTKLFLTSDSTWRNTTIGASGVGSPDSFEVVIIGGRDSGTTFNIDFAYFFTESVENLTARLQPRLFPNPMHQHATLHINNSEHTAYRWILNDAIGRTVAMQRNLTGEVITIDRNNLPPGFYCWQLWDERDGGRAAGTLTME